MSITTVHAAGLNTSSLTGTFAWNSQGSNFWKAGTYISTIKYLDSGSITFNGTGGCSVSGEDNHYEVSFSNPSTVTERSDTFSGEVCTYTVAPDGYVQLSAADSDFWLSPDGNVLIGGKALTSSESDGVLYETDQLIFVKKGTGLNTSSLTGTFAWNSQGLNFWKAGTYISTIKYLDSGSITFNGTGGCSISGGGKSYEVGFGAPSSVTERSDTFSGEVCTYTVAPDGYVQLSAADSDFWLSPDGNVLIGGKALTSSESDGVLYETDQLVFVKKGTEMNTSSLTGTFAFNDQALNFWKYTVGGTYIYDNKILSSGTITFDGTGGCSVSGEDKEYEVSFSNPSTVTERSDTFSESCTYTVAPDGAVQLDIADIDFWLSADGNVFIGGKALTSSESDGVDYETEQFIGVKKALVQTKTINLTSMLLLLL